MAYADPQILTIATVANTLPRVGSAQNAGTFQKDDGSVKLSVSSSYGKRIRRTARADFQKVAPDPLVSSTNVRSMSTYLVVDTPIQGYTIAEQNDNILAHLAWLTANSGANLLKLLGGEN